jgi:ribose transport system substrate-binding protein
MPEPLRYSIEPAATMSLDGDPIMVRRAGLGLALAACLALLGCTGSQENYKYRIGVIPKGLTHEFWQSIHRGAQRAADDLREQRKIGVQVLWDGPNKESEAQEQIGIVHRQVAAGVNGIVLAPQHSETLVPSVQQAVNQGVPVVIIDSGLANTDIIVKYVATDNYHGGRLAAQRLLDVLKAEGKTNPKLILFRYAPGSESTEKREKGFEDYIAEQEKDGKVKVNWLSKDKYAGATVDSAQKEATPLLNNLRDQEIDGIFAPNESSASGMLNALRSLKMNGKVKLVGFDSSEFLLNALRDGDVDGLVVQDPYRMGYLGVWTLVMHLEGYDVAPGGKKVQSTGEYLVTRDNLDAPPSDDPDQPSPQQLFDRDLQAKRKIKVPDYPKKK